MSQSACHVVLPIIMVIERESAYKLGQGNWAGMAEPPVGQGLGPCKLLALGQEAHLLTLHTLKWAQSPTNDPVLPAFRTQMASSKNAVK